LQSPPIHISFTTTEQSPTHAGLLAYLFIADEIVKESKNQNVIVMRLDLSSQKSVREFAAEVVKTEQKLDVLIHNAGYAETFNKNKSADGVELTMATNHYGPFLLTHLLIDLLKKSTPSRIVIVASSLYRFANVDLDNLNPLTTFPAYLYYVSKGANIMFALELAKRLKNANITVNCLHPGMIKSEIWRNVPFPLTIGMAFIKGFFKTVQEGCQTTLFLACSESVANVSGKYFSDCKEAELQPYITEPAKCYELWEKSAKIVNLTASDPKI